MGGLTVNDALDHAWKVCWSRCKSPEKKANLVQQVRNEMGHIPLKTLCYNDYEDWLLRLRDIRKSPSTIRSRFFVLSRALKLVEPKGWIERIPPTPELEVAGEGRQRWLSQDEELALFKATSCLPEVEAQIMMDAMIFALDTGCRLGELIKVRDDALLPTGVVFRNRKGGDTLALPLTERALDALSRLLDTIQWMDLVKGSRDSVDRAESAQNWVTKRFRKIRDYAGMPDVVFHTCRHTCASRLMQRGVGIYEVKSFMGHVSVTTTEKYVHLAPTSLIMAKNALEERA